VEFHGPLPLEAYSFVVLVDLIPLRATVAKLSLKVTQNEQKQGKSKKQKLSLSCSWQRGFGRIFWVDSESAI
jgi:hypothetical protein